jgi:hypothetical protein
MKGLLRMPLALVWRMTAWLRRPFVREVARACREAVAPDLAAQTEGLRGRNERMHALLLQLQDQVQGQNRTLAELSLALDSTVRELARLHAQLDTLAPATADFLPPRRERADAC